MANTIEIKLLDNKRAEALVEGYPYALEGNYHIIAGEVNATEFVLSSVPSQYADCEFEIEGYNAAKEMAKEFVGQKYTIGSTFVLPVGMASAGYSQINFSTVTSDGENVKWLPIKLKIYNTAPDWASGSISQADQLKGEIAAVAVSVEGVKGSVDEMTSTVSGLNDTVSGLSSDVADIQAAIENVKSATMKMISNDSLNYESSTDEQGNTVITVTDEDITSTSHIDLYPTDVDTETFLSAALVMNVMEVGAGQFQFLLNTPLPDTWSLYYLILEAK